MQASQRRVTLSHPVLPWETIKRLLGLPAEMEPPETVELVRMAIEQPRHSRLIAMALRGRVPKEAPAAMLVAARDRGALSARATAELLGCVGHSAGYETVRTLLFTSEETDACAASGVAAARILGQRAESALSLALWLAPERAGREGAALGLCELGTADAAASIAHAGHQGRIRTRVAVRCAVRMPFDATFWLEQLESKELRDRRYGTELVYELLSSSSRAARQYLEELGERGRSGVRRALEDDELYMLPEKREILARWVVQS
jgi:hypothetical protein